MRRIVSEIWAKRPKLCSMSIAGVCFTCVEALDIALNWLLPR